MTDQDIKAYVNMFGVLKNLEVLPGLDKETNNIIQNVNKVLMLSVGEGPSVRIIFSKGSISLSEQEGPADVKFGFNSTEDFNKMFSEGAGPSSVEGADDTAFLAVIQGVVGRLTYFLVPNEKKMQDAGFMGVFGSLTIQTLFLAIAQANMYDETAKAVASHIPDGTMQILVGKEICIKVTGHEGVYTGEFGYCDNPIGILEFRDLQVAMGFIQGQVNFREAIPVGDMDLRGHVMVVATFLGLIGFAGKYLG